MSDSKVYLGDSVYADTSDEFLVLTTENGLPGSSINRIYLEPEVIVALLNYLDHPLKGDTIPLTLYYHQSLHSDRIDVKSYEYAYDTNTTVIAVQEVLVPAVPLISHAELATKIIARLREKQATARAEAFEVDKKIEDEIQNLLALPAPSLDPNSFF